jgi:hypothetical protein
MLLRALSCDFLKLRHTLVWFLIFLGPIGVVGLQAVNYGLRYDYLMKQYAADLWGNLIIQVVSLMVPVCLMGLTIIASMITNMEHQTNAWKQTLALPVSRFTIITSKFVMAAILLLCSTTMLVIGTIILGLCLGMPASDIPYSKLLTVIYFSYMASMPFIALQVWLSATVSNQAIPLTVGIIGMILSLFANLVGDWMPWGWPNLRNEWGEPLYSVAAGIALGLLLYIGGLFHFIRKEVN